jgi:hypothetical protein
MSTAVSKEVIRLELGMTFDQFRMMKELMKHTTAKTKKGFIMGAIDLVKEAIEEIREGRIIASVDMVAKTYTEAPTSWIKAPQQTYKRPKLVLVCTQGDT